MDDVENISIYFEIPAKDAMGWDEVEGKIRGFNDEVVIHWKVKDRTFSKKTTTMNKLVFAYPELEEVSLKKRWFRPKLLVFKTRDPEKLSEIPGIDMGQAELEISKRSSEHVEKLAKFLDFKVSEYRLEKSQERLRKVQEDDGFDPGDDLSDL